MENKTLVAVRHYHHNFLGRLGGIDRNDGESWISRHVELYRLVTHHDHPCAGCLASDQLEAGI